MKPLFVEAARQRQVDLSARQVIRRPLAQGEGMSDAVRNAAARKAAKEYGVTPEAMFSENSTRRVARARYRAFRILFATGRYSEAEIGRGFKRDPSTVHYGIHHRRRRKPGGAPTPRPRPAAYAPEFEAQVQHAFMRLGGSWRQHAAAWGIHWRTAKRIIHKRFPDARTPR